MSRNYKFYNPQGVYFVSFAVKEWIDIFTRNKYKDIIIENLSFCQKNKGLEIYAKQTTDYRSNLFARYDEKSAVAGAEHAFGLPHF